MIFASLATAQDKNLNERLEELEPLIVESSPLNTKVEDLTQAWSVLNKSELEKAKANTIADTLANQPGIHQTYFGPSSNRPIIRGLGKHRIRMLQNGVESFGFSASSDDHAVNIDPMFIERIEMLRGSSALLYGSNAIGGAVNVIDRSIPSRSFAGSPGAVFRTGYNSVNDGWNVGGMGFAGTESLSFQINGFNRDYDNYDSPVGKIANSMGESHSYGLGGSRIWDNGYAGMSFSTLENVYGVPGEHADLETRIEMESDRFQARSEFDVTGSDFLKSVQLTLGYGDYLHNEIGKEDENATETETHSTFIRDGFETRIAFVHELGSLRGVFGFHGLFDNLKIAGEDSIFGGDEANGTIGAISGEDSSRIAFFLMEEFDLGDTTLVNAGIRWENHDRDLQGEKDTDESIFSAAGGISQQLGEEWTLSGNLNYTERTPETAELYSFGPHHGTESFEIGNPALKNETATGVEVILRRNIGKVTGQLSAFHTQFDNYVFLEANGNERLVHGEDMREMQYEGAKAEFRGLEAEIDWLALENPGWSLLLSAYGDMVRGKNETEGTYLPRIPASRLGVGFEIQADRLTFGMDLNHAFKQDEIPVHEEETGGGGGHDDHDHEPTPTASHSLLNAYASYDLSMGDAAGQIFLRGHNLTDELARLHTSLLKDSAPLPGAGVEIGLRLDF